MPSGDGDLERLAEKAIAEYAKTSDERHEFLTERNMLFDALDAIPIPFWIKHVDPAEGMDGSWMFFINDAYALRWNIEKSSYLGKSDVDVWGRLIATEFYENDLEAIRRYPQPVFAREPVPEQPGQEENAPDWSVVKRQVISQERHLVVGCSVLGGDAERMFQELEKLRDEREAEI